MGKRDSVDERYLAGRDVVEGADDGDLALTLHIAERGATFAKDGKGVRDVFAGDAVGESRFSSGSPL